jgi:hypothetical protein
MKSNRFVFLLILFILSDVGFAANSHEWRNFPFGIDPEFDAYVTEVDQALLRPCNQSQFVQEQINSLDALKIMPLSKDLSQYLQPIISETKIKLNPINADLFRLAGRFQGTGSQFLYWPYVSDGAGRFVADGSTMWSTGITNLLYNLKYASQLKNAIESNFSSTEKICRSNLNHYIHITSPDYTENPFEKLLNPNTQFFLSTKNWEFWKQEYSDLKSKFKYGLKTLNALAKEQVDRNEFFSAVCSKEPRCIADQIARDGGFGIHFGIVVKDLKQYSTKLNMQTMKKGIQAINDIENMLDADFSKISTTSSKLKKNLEEYSVDSEKINTKFRCQYFKRLLPVAAKYQRLFKRLDLQFPYWRYELYRSEYPTFEIVQSEIRNCE